MEISRELLEHCPLFAQISAAQAWQLLDELNVLAGDGVKVVVTVSADMDVLPESVKKYA